MKQDIKQKVEHLLQTEISSTSGNIIKSTSGNTYYLKAGLPSPTYQCEANGLQELDEAEAIRVAKVAAVGSNFIVTEYIEQAKPKGNFFIELGKSLALLHRKQASAYGFYEDNFIGASPQNNTATGTEKSDWVDFYFNKRLLFQYQLAEQNKVLSRTLKRDFPKLEQCIEAIIGDSIEPPTLLHGDLWAGNFLCNKQNHPILIDPAVYYGHREAELAMTRLFGGFAPAFYSAYEASYPLKPGWQYREGIYRLYHVLNHLNLFGYSYIQEAEYLTQKYLLP